MKTIKTLLAAAVAAVTFAGMASAATMNAYFTLEVVQLTNADEAESTASSAAFTAAWGASAVKGTGYYNGDLDFRIGSGNSGSTYVADFLNTGSADWSTGLLDAATTLLSNTDVFQGTATTTFFRFTLANVAAGDFAITHDDGMSITGLGGTTQPTSEITTLLPDFAGGPFELIYVATNGNPSVLEVDYEAAAVPLPASLPLLLVGFGGLAALRRRKKAA
ncbi:VPLPA-CTERM sorting domain-containing protein [Pseudooceanicola onchidii]|uniref:VPLPA-CTERM sorting domain-containing protein n=1 Tax=Pseudooceanicola onchidii TaxID=2562279 RepID=UPI0010AA71A7|nr:VPLPA-CTERM sorting domain-containing protein [Pseudooceanicola onchidii]